MISSSETFEPPWVKESHLLNPEVHLIVESAELFTSIKAGLVRRHFVVTSPLSYEALTIEGTLNADALIVSSLNYTPLNMRTFKATSRRNARIITIEVAPADIAGLLDQGVDACTPSGASVDEIVSVIVNALRRDWPELVGGVLTFADLSMDRFAHRVRRNGKALDMGIGEFAALEFFIRHPRQIFSHEDLMLEFGNPDAPLTRGGLKHLIHRLMRALKQREGLASIRSMRNVGYSLDESAQVNLTY